MKNENNLPKNGSQIGFEKDFFDISIFIYLNLLLDHEIDSDQYEIV